MANTVRNTNVLNKTRMKDDPLRYLLVGITFNLKGYTVPIKIFKGLIVLYLQTFNAIGLVYICRDETGMFMRKYISIILIQQIGISSHILLFFYTTSILRLSYYAKMCFLPFNISSYKLQNNIQIECVRIRKLVLVATTLLIALSGSYLLGDGDEIHFTVMFIKKYTGSWSYILLGLHYFCLITLGYSTGTIFSCCIYIFVHLKFQLSILSDYLRNISDGYKPNNEDNFYQKAIYERLKFFIQVHNDIKMASLIFLGVVQVSVVVTTIMASLSYTGLGYSLFVSISPSNTVRGILTIIIGSFSTCMLARYGQKLQDESNKLLATACECEWIYWNIQNRKHLLMIIINSMKVTKLTGFGLLDVGHEIILRIVKVTYSMVLLFVNVNK